MHIISFKFNMFLDLNFYFQNILLIYHNKLLPALSVHIDFYTVLLDITYENPGSGILR